VEAAQQLEHDLDEATRVVLPVGIEARARFARARVSAAVRLAGRRDANRLSRSLTTMALRDLLAVRALLLESGDLRVVVDTLLLGLEQRQPAIRYRCAEALDHFGDERCFEPLSRLVTDAVPRVRRMALHALGCDACKLTPLPRECDVLPLIIDRALNDPSIAVRRAAASVLCQHTHDPRAFDVVNSLAGQERDGAILRSVHRVLRRLQSAPA
jgi:HEAT repeat protein